jgi:hypothetical protein
MELGIFKQLEMTPFTYIYYEKECKGNFLPSERGYGWFKVFFNDHSAFILRSGIQAKENKMIWVQCVQHDEPVWPHELVQALGEAIEEIEGHHE